MEKILFTSESVTEGHPDKMCDAISDAILDAIMEQDPMGRVACETATTTGLVLVMGEITTTANIDIQQIVRDTVREIGYDRGKFGFDADTGAAKTDSSDRTSGNRENCDHGAGGSRVQSRACILHDHASYQTECHWSSGDCGAQLRGKRNDGDRLYDE